MKFIKLPYQESDFLRVRDFLVESVHANPDSRNWQIDRWNFCRYVSQTIHETTGSWPGTVGLWVDEEDQIQAVVNSEGENRGEAFFQLREQDYPDRELRAFLDHAEKQLVLVHEDGSSELNLSIDPGLQGLIAILEERGYQRAGMEQAGIYNIRGPLEVELPAGLRLVEGSGFDDRARAMAHSLAFGYADEDPAVLRRYHIVEAFENMRRAPDYCAGLDLAVLAPDGEVAAFATFWLDDRNQLGVLEPLGTIPSYQKQGLARALLSEGANRLAARGARRLYGGAGQPFYERFGFEIVDFRARWKKEWGSDQG